jgi:hypothetical protein
VPPEKCCGSVKRVFVGPNWMSGIYEYSLCAYIEDQSAMVNLRAVILLIRWVWAANNSRSIMRVPVSGRISSVFRRIFLLSVFLRNRCCLHHRVGCSCVKCIPLLGVSRRANQKEPGYNYGDGSHEFCVHIRSSVKIFAAGNSDGCPARQIQKRFEQLRRDPACLLQFA